MKFCVFLSAFLAFLPSMVHADPPIAVHLTGDLAHHTLTWTTRPNHSYSVE